MRYAILLVLLFSIKALACDDLLPADASKFSVPPMSNGEITGVGGIVEFGGKNNDCTLDCRCVYNFKTSAWEVQVAPKQVCVFMNQCTFCKGTDKECEIRFIDSQNDSLYKKTFFANDPNKSKVQKCYQTKLKSVQCEEVTNLPDYNQVKPLG